jgi:hypothetical protein
MFQSLHMVKGPAYTRAHQQFWTHIEQHLFALFDLARNTKLAADLPNCFWGKTVCEVGFCSSDSQPKGTADPEGYQVLIIAKSDISIGSLSRAAATCGLSFVWLDESLN